MLEPGQQIYFKRDTDRRTRKGQIVGGNSLDGWQVQGRRQANSFVADVYQLTSDQIQTEEAFKASRSRSTIHETISTHGRQITATEMNRRAKVAVERLQLTETQVLQARAMLEIRKRTLRSLAYKNRICTTATDFEFEELSSEYLVAALTAFRTATSKAPVADLDEFRRFIAGEPVKSCIMLTIAKTGKTAAIRYLKARSQYHQRHVDIFDYADRMAA